MNIELLLLSYAGLLLHYLTRFNELLTAGKTSGIKWPQEIIGGLITIISTTILVYVKDDIANIYVVTPLGAVLLGYAGQSLFVKLVNARSPVQKFDAPSTDPKEPPKGNP